MPLSSLFQRLRQMAASGQGAAPEAVHVSPLDVEVARTRARRRLVGMVVLVGAGVIGFPWLFETQPRSMSQDVEMVQAHVGMGGADDGGLSVARGASRATSGRVAVAGIVPPPQERSAPEERPAREPAEIASAEREAISSQPPAVPALKEPAAKAAAKAAEKSAEKSPPKAAVKPADKPTDKVGTRYVVQFGAFADATAARATRMKVERLGIKTYAQQVDTPGGKRIRVRIGPFTDRAEADKALASLRKAGLTGAVLTL